MSEALPSLSSGQSSERNLDPPRRFPSGSSAPEGLTAVSSSPSTAQSSGINPHFRSKRELQIPVGVAAGEVEALQNKEEVEAYLALARALEQKEELGKLIDIASKAIPLDRDLLTRLIIQKRTIDGAVNNARSNLDVVQKAIRNAQNALKAQTEVYERLLEQRKSAPASLAADAAVAAASAPAEKGATPAGAVAHGGRRHTSKRRRVSHRRKRHTSKRGSRRS